MATYAHNKKASFEYEFMEQYEGGLSLLGHEVKSVKANKADLTGAFVAVRGDEAFLVGANIPPYQVNNTDEKYDPERSRKVLVTKKEIDKLKQAEAKKGLTLIPISLYNKGRVIKLSFAVARGKKKYDKRESIKQRDTERDIERTLKNRR